MEITMNSACSVDSACSEKEKADRLTYRRNFIFTFFHILLSSIFIAILMAITLFLGREIWQVFSLENTDFYTLLPRCISVLFISLAVTDISYIVLKFNIYPSLDHLSWHKPEEIPSVPHVISDYQARIKSIMDAKGGQSLPVSEMKEYCLLYKEMCQEDLNIIEKAHNIKHHNKRREFRSYLRHVFVAVNVLVFYEVLRDVFFKVGHEMNNLSLILLGITFLGTMGILFMLKLWEREN